MAGRAGRRGLDPTGTVIIIANDSLPEQTTLHTMMLGTPGKLSSQFRLTYNMILNLLRVEALKVEEMIKRSFSENASQRLLPDQQKKVIEASNTNSIRWWPEESDLCSQSEKVLSTLQKLECDICFPDINNFYDDCFDIATLNQRLLSMAVAHPQGAKSMMGGRVIILRDGHFKSYTAAILLKPAPLQTSESGLLEKIKTYYVLALVSPGMKSGEQDIDNQAIPPYWPPTPKSLVVDDGVYELRAVPLTSVASVTNRSVKVEVDSIVERHLISRMKDGIAALQALVDEWQLSGEIPENEWDRMRAMDFQELLQSRSSITQRLSKRSCTLCGDFTDHYAVIHGEKVLRANIANLKLAISDQNLELIPDYEQRVAVLQELRFIDENSTVLLKGRVACEINSANELVLTELILENTLAGYEPEEVVALLSCFVFQEKTEVEPVIPPKLETGRDEILAISDRVGRIQDYHKVAVEDFRSNLKFGLVEVVYEWAKGMPFEQITTLTDVAEGTIVRVITRLDETCREVRDAARVIGDAELFKKMEEAQIKIKRDSLRVAKEDRHTNLTRGRLSKALARQQLEKPSSVTTPDVNRRMEDETDRSLDETPPIERPIQAPETQVTPIIKASIKKRKRLLESPELLAASRSAKLVASERITELNLGRQRNVVPEGTCTLTVYKELPLKKHRIAPMAPLIESSPPKTSSPCPAFAPLENVLNSFDDRLFYPGLYTSSDFSLGFCDPACTDIPFNDCQQNFPAVVAEQHPLSQVERQELYNLINDNIGSTFGVVEKAGTYCAYMKEHSQHHFDRASLNANYTTGIYHAQHGGLYSDSEATMADEEVDFRNWLYGYDELDIDKGSQADSHIILHEGETTPGSIPQIGVTVNSLVRDDADSISSSLPDKLISSFIGSPSPFPRLHSDYKVDSPAMPTQSTLPNTPFFTPQATSPNTTTDDPESNYERDEQFSCTYWFFVGKQSRKRMYPLADP
ncbi:hypothetical protein C0991_007543 [Blastosporella zonata]|nr:hypothetical protein C0991_007543 [Blastosporella zonata]